MPILHPVNIPIWEVFTMLSSQVRVGGMGEFVGYDLSILPLILAANHIPEEDWPVYVTQMNVLTEVARNAFKQK